MPAIELRNIQFRFIDIDYFHLCIISSSYTFIQKRDTTKISQRKSSFNCRQLFLLQIFPNSISHKQKLRLGMIGNMVYIVRIKVLQNWNYNSAISNYRQISNRPVGVIPAY